MHPHLQWESHTYLPLTVIATYHLPTGAILPIPQKTASIKPTEEYINFILIVQDVVASIESDVPQAMPPTEFHLRLSSKHLMLASPRLRKMFTGDWREATEKNEDGLLTWRVGDSFDPSAFITVMNIVHGRNKDVPRVVDLESLAKIAVVTDDLQCDDAIGIYPDAWINGLKNSLPSTYCRELIFWIMISFFFHDQHTFSSATRTAILGSDNEVPSLGVPIHEDIISKPSGTSNTAIV